MTAKRPHLSGPVEVSSELDRGARGLAIRELGDPAAHPVHRLVLEAVQLHRVADPERAIAARHAEQRWRDFNATLVQGDGRRSSINPVYDPTDDIARCTRRRANGAGCRCGPRLQRPPRRGSGSSCPGFVVEGSGRSLALLPRHTSRCPVLCVAAPRREGCSDRLRVPRLPVPLSCPHCNQGP